MNNSSYIVIQTTRPPYSTSDSIEALEAAMAATNLGIEVVFIFVGEGVYQLLSKQENTVIFHKSMFKKLLALPLFDIESIHAESSALIQYDVGLPVEMPLINALDGSQIADLCRFAKHVLVF